MWLNCSSAVDTLGAGSSVLAIGVTSFQGSDRLLLWVILFILTVIGSLSFCIAGYSTPPPPPPPRPVMQLVSFIPRPHPSHETVGRGVAWERGFEELFSP